MNRRKSLTSYAPDPRYCSKKKITETWTSFEQSEEIDQGVVTERKIGVERKVESGTGIEIKIEENVKTMEHHIGKFLRMMRTEIGAVRYVHLQLRSRFHSPDVAES